MSSMREANLLTEKLLDLLSDAEKLGYIGEAISQLQHALQAAYFASQYRHSEDIIIAALCHDIGHYCYGNELPQMADLGTIDHEKLGAKYLLDNYFNNNIADLVAGHVQAKRYLVSRKRNYVEQLSTASRGTLNFQGGPMSSEEIKAFTTSPLFKEKLLIRVCDERAKEHDLKVPGLSAYRKMIRNHIMKNLIAAHELT